jgi:hypothetical protein
VAGIIGMEAPGQESYCVGTGQNLAGHVALALSCIKRGFFVIRSSRQFDTLLVSLGVETPGFSCYNIYIG